MLEFWIDPECTYCEDIFACGKKFLFHCNLVGRHQGSDDTRGRTITTH
jgi:hypothetical protein